MSSPSRSDPAQDFSLWFLRLSAGGFLLWEVLDNIVSSARMREFAEFLAAHGYPWPMLMAILSVGFQCCAGMAWLLGWYTRTVAVGVALHFALAWVSVHLDDSLRAGWPVYALGLTPRSTSKFDSSHSNRCGLPPTHGRRPGTSGSCSAAARRRDAHRSTPACDPVGGETRTSPGRG